MSQDLKTKIGIIGAGPAGLTAAEALKAKGYTDIVLLERLDRVGGKCCSIEYKGRKYELGAGAISEDQRTVMDLARKYGVNYERVRYSKNGILDLEAKPVKKLGPWAYVRLGLQLIKYRSLCKRYADAIAPGHKNVAPELFVPFSELAKKEGIELLATKLAPFFSGFGYGYFEEIPAIYVLKYYPWETVVSFIRKDIYTFPEGIEHLWTVVAKQYQVEYDVEIQKIERSGRVLVETNKGEFAFNKLLIAAPLDESLNYLDASQEERELFSQIKHIDYRTYACRVEGIPKHNGYVPANFCQEREGHPVFWYYRFTDSDLCTFYVIANGQLSDETAAANIADYVQKLGGRVLEVRDKPHWKYFPHVDTEQMRAGYYERLEALQAQNSTYYLGELLNFSTVNVSAMYSEALIERFF